MEHLVIPSLNIVQVVREKSDVDCRDKKTVHSLYLKMGPALVVKLRSMVRQEGVAEELLHEVFVRLWEKSPDFPGEKEAFSWLYRITTNIGIDYLRRHSTKFEREISSDFESGLTEYMGHECRSELEFIFKELTEEESQILIFHTVDQMEKNEISKILSIPLRSLHRKFSRLDEKIQKLRERTYDT